MDDGCKITCLKGVDLYKWSCWWTWTYIIDECGLTWLKDVDLHDWRVRTCMIEGCAIVDLHDWRGWTNIIDRCGFTMYIIDGCGVTILIGVDYLQYWWVCSYIIDGLGLTWLMGCKRVLEVGRDVSAPSKWRDPRLKDKIEYYQYMHIKFHIYRLHR